MNWQSIAIDNIVGFPLGDGTILPSVKDPGKLNQKVREALRSRKGSIKQAPLPSGSSGWDAIENLTMKEVQYRARQAEVCYKTIWKLLNDSQFAK